MTASKLTASTFELKWRNFGLDKIWRNWLKMPKISKLLLFSSCAKLNPCQTSFLLFPSVYCFNNQYTQLILILIKLKKVYNIFEKFLLHLFLNLVQISSLLKLNQNIPNISNSMCAKWNLHQNFSTLDIFCTIGWNM